MNISTTAGLARQNGVVMIVADKTRERADIDQLLAQLGNQSGAIPFYAIFPAERPNEPILLSGVITPGMIQDALRRAGPSQASAAQTARQPVRAAAR